MSYLFLFISLNYINFFFFFFQAEDGIRDLLVTGVQTCVSDLGRAQPAVTFAAVVDQSSCAADVSWPGLARRGALPTASGHEGRAGQGVGSRYRRYSQRVARPEYRLFRRQPRRQCAGGEVQ